MTKKQTKRSRAQRAKDALHRAQHNLRTRVALQLSRIAAWIAPAE